MDKAKESDCEAMFEYGGISYEKKYGDFIIWTQIITDAKKRKANQLVLLTDDVKEDWWWIIKNNKIGPRPELRDEINRIAGVTKFHIYNSEQFLRYSGEYLNAKVSENSIQAAKDILESQKQTTSPENIVDKLILDIVDDLVNSDEKVVSIMAGTNAYGYGLDDYEIHEAEFNKYGKQISFITGIWIGGEQDQDKPFCGDEISITLSGILELIDSNWLLKSYELLDYELNW